MSNKLEVKPQCCARRYDAEFYDENHELEMLLNDSDVYRHAVIFVEVLTSRMRAYKTQMDDPLVKEWHFEDQIVRDALWAAVRTIEERRQAVENDKG